MRSSYITVSGDTLALISRKSYGVETEAGRIASANPGVSEPISPGTALTIPARPETPGDKVQDTKTSGINEVSVSIDGARFRFWESVSIRRAIDTVDTVNLSAPFEPDAPGFKDAFRPFAFKPLTVSVGGETLFTGTVVNVSPPLSATRRTVGLTGYSLPGVLADCTMPSSAFPIECHESDLQAIAAAMAKPFGLGVEFSDAAGPIFADWVGCEPNQTVMDFLKRLATQKGFVIGSTPDGALYFVKSVQAGAPVAILRSGASPLLSVTPRFNPQGYYSHITGIQSGVVGSEGGQYPAVNPHLAGVLRPHTFTVDDARDGDLSTAVVAKMGRMFGAAVGYSVEVSTWRDPAGTLWTPNTTLKLNAPGAMVYNDYEFLVRSVEFSRSGQGETATLSLTLPGAFSGEIPEALPWD